MVEKIVLIGSYGASNIGDEAMLDVLYTELSKKYFVSVLSGDRNDTVRRHNIESERVRAHLPFGLRSFFSFQWLATVKTLFQSKKVLFGGGGLFVDDQGIKAILLWSYHVFISKILGNEVIIFANSFHPLQSGVSKKVLSLALSFVEKIIVRDVQSYEYLKSLGYEHKLEQGVDPVFFYDISSCNPAKKRVAVNFRPWKMRYESCVEWSKQKQQEGFDLIFIASDVTDVEIHEKYFKHIPMIMPSSFSEMQIILSRCEYAYGMRLHFLLAAILSGSKVVGISYSSKVSGILQSCELPFIRLADMKKSHLEYFFKQATQAKNREKHKETIKRLLKHV
ncbi:hypothetical protein COB57_00295 [Candidatus Peregrinibacteria bacterium]|nr:MAG: hypothetical protein COB57_00295 [Candidatus Peregrinibacteria bacterium]